MKPLFKKNQILPSGVKILKVYPVGHKYASKQSNYYLVNSPEFGEDVISETAVQDL